ncbi:chemotaxis protein CheB [Veronia nyctiphanis]|nr:chemotaxis protein CheB [Veronia nyctiphanis]
MAEIFIRSGEMGLFHQQDSTLNTIAGVCAVVCVWDTRQCLGGMCHYRLPIAPAVLETFETHDDYGSTAIPKLLGQFKQAGSDPDDLLAWVIGGGEIGSGRIMNAQKIGARNIAQALTLLALYGVQLKRFEFGGDSGRQIRFDINTGAVYFRQILSDSHTGSDNARDNSLNRLSPSDRPIDLLFHDHSLVQSVLFAIKETNTLRHIRVFTDITEAVQAAEETPPGILLSDASSTLCQLTNKPYISTNLLNVSQICPAIRGEHLSMLKRQFMGCVLTSHIKYIRLGIKNVIHMESLCRQLPEACCKSSNISDKDKGDIKAINVIGSSTGGIEALETILSSLSIGCPPICIAQHIPADYSASLVERLNDKCDIDVLEATDGMQILASTAYIAPGDHHMKVVELPSGKLVINLSDEPEIEGFRPSVDYLFHSIAKIKHCTVTAALLSGMGHDGAKELLALKKNGALTLIQDEQSSVVFGMGRSALELGAVCRAVTLQNMAAIMNKKASIFTKTCSH